MKRGLYGVLVMVLVLTLLAGCGGASSDKATTGEMPSAGMQDADAGGKSTEAASQNQTSPKDNNQTSPTEQADGYTAISGETKSEAVSSAILSQRKVIRNASLAMEVENFDSTYSQIRSLIAPYGYVQETNIQKDKRYQDGKELLLARGVIILRIDRDKFDDVVNGIKGIGQVTGESITTDDVTEKYFDVDSRLRLLRFEEGRLEQFLQKQTDPDVIFKMENHLTDIRHEIESLTGTLRKLDDLVALSTITLTISEKALGQALSIEKSYWSKVGGGFAESLRAVGDFLGKLVIMLAQLLPVLMLIAIPFGICFYIYRRRSAKGTTYPDKRDPQEKQ